MARSPGSLNPWVAANVCIKAAQAAPRHSSARVTQDYYMAISKDEMRQVADKYRAAMAAAVVHKLEHNATGTDAATPAR